MKQVGQWLLSQKGPADRGELEGERGKAEVLLQAKYN